jgi:hypothetical protein
MNSTTRFPNPYADADMGSLRGRNGEGEEKVDAEREAERICGEAVWLGTYPRANRRSPGELAGGEERESVEDVGEREEWYETDLLPLT